MAARIAHRGRLLSLLSNHIASTAATSTPCHLAQTSCRKGSGQLCELLSTQNFWQGGWRSFASLPEHSELQMPALSPTMAQGNVHSWEVKEGDELEAGTVLATIETDKATLEWENQEDGFLAKILVEAGAKDIAVGTPLAIVVENEEDVEKFKDYKPSGSSKSGSSKSSQPKSSESKDSGEAEGRQDEAKSEKSESHHRKIDGNQRIGPAARLMLHHHNLSMSDVKGTGPYGIITKGDVLEALESGVQPGGKSEKAESKTSSSKAEGQEQASQKGPSSEQKSKSTTSSKTQPQGSGVPAQGQNFTDVPNSQIRKIIATRLLESKQSVPHYYVKAVAELDAVNKLRESMKSQGTKVSLNDFVVRAVALALQDVPQANATWDSKSQEPKTLESVDVAIAVATDKGLITPILKKANTKALKEISAEVKELAGRARANKLKPEEFQGGTFTISNLGMFGIDSFSAIINPPQAGILAVGGTQHIVQLEGGRPISKPYMNLVLSADQRVFDGETSSKFLSALCSNLANPVKLVI